MDLFKISPSIVLIALIHVTRAFAKGKLSYVEIKHTAPDQQNPTERAVLVRARLSNGR